MREEAEKTIFLYGFEKTSVECDNTASCSVYVRDAVSILEVQISKTMDDKFIHTSHKGQIFSQSQMPRLVPKHVLSFKDMSGAAKPDHFHGKLLTVTI